MMTSWFALNVDVHSAVFQSRNLDVNRSDLFTRILRVTTSAFLQSVVALLITSSTKYVTTVTYLSQHYSNTSPVLTAVL